MQAVPHLLEHLRKEANRVIVGQEEFRDQCLATLLCRGHESLGRSPVYPRCPETCLQIGTRIDHNE